MLKALLFTLLSPTIIQGQPSGTYIGTQIITSYQSIKAQTDDSPFITSIGERVHQDGVAVSQDQLCPAGKGCRRNVKMFCNTSKVHYKDVVWIEDIGFKIVNDCMNERHRNRFDVWVKNYGEEYAFDQRFGKRRLKVWLIRGDTNETSKKILR